VVQHSAEKIDTLTIYANLDEHGHAEGWLYEDGAMAMATKRANIRGVNCMLQSLGKQAKLPCLLERKRELSRNQKWKLIELR